MKATPTLSLIIPTFNEADNLEMLALLFIDRWMSKPSRVEGKNKTASDTER